MKCSALLKIWVKKLNFNLFGKTWDVQFTTIRMDNYQTSILLHPRFRHPPNRFQEPYSVKYFKVIKRLKSLQKAEAYEASVYDRALLRIYLTAYYFCNKSSITDVQLGYI